MSLISMCNLHIGRPAISSYDLQKISQVKFRQGAAVLAYITVHWLDGRGKERSMDLGHWMSINQEAIFNLEKEGVPDGSVTVNIAPLDESGSLT